MEIRNLNTFLTVANLRNFTRASRELGYSQSNVSAQIKQLEQEIGVPLFDRIGRSVYLTTYGEQLIPYAQKIVSTSVQITDFLKPEAEMRGIVRIGMVSSLSELLQESVYLHYHRRFPLVSLELMVDATETLKDRLIHGQLDTACVIDEPLPPSNWNIWNHVQTPIVFIANPDHPLAGRKKLRLQDIVNQDFVLMEETAPYNVHLARTLAGMGLSISPFLTLQNPLPASRLVESGPFLSLLPLYSVLPAIQEHRIVMLPIADWNYAQNVQLILGRSKVMTPPTQGFLEEIQRELAHAMSQRMSAAFETAAPAATETTFRADAEDAADTPAAVDADAPAAD